MTLHGISGFGGTRVWGSRPSNGVGCTGRPENIQSICIDSPLTATHNPLPLKQPLCRNIPHSLHTFNHLFSFTLFYCVMNSKIFTYSFFYCSLNLVKRSGDQISRQNFKFRVWWGGGGAFWRFYFNFVDWSYSVNEKGVIWLYSVDWYREQIYPSMISLWLNINLLLHWTNAEGRTMA